MKRQPYYIDSRRTTEETVSEIVTRTCRSIKGTGKGRHDMKKITEMNFGKAVKAVIILAVAAVLCGVAASAVFMNSLPESAYMMHHHEYEEEMLLSYITWQSAVPAAAAAILGAAAVIVLWITVCVYVYKKAKEADMNSTGWLIAALFLNLIGLAVFAGVRSATREKCSVCGTWQKPSRYCRKCGTEFYKICGTCGEKIMRGEKFCPKCGSPAPSDDKPDGGNTGEPSDKNDEHALDDGKDDGKKDTADDSKDEAEKKDE